MLTFASLLDPLGSGLLVAPNCSLVEGSDFTQTEDCNLRLDEPWVTVSLIFHS